MSQALQFFILTTAGWFNRQQQQVIEYLQAGGGDQNFEGAAGEWTAEIHGCAAPPLLDDGLNVPGRDHSPLVRTHPDRIDVGLLAPLRIAEPSELAQLALVRRHRESRFGNNCFHSDPDLAGLDQLVGILAEGGCSALRALPRRAEPPGLG
jgi:hypothetical protein